MRNPITYILLILLAFTLSACGGGGDISTAKVGDTVEFGGYNWRVLDIQDGKALIISEKILGKRAYHSLGGDISWEGSELREYLNGSFYESTFTEEEKKNIAKSNIENKCNPQYGTTGGSETKDKVFLLSIEEVERYFTDSSEMIAENIDTDEVSWWWLRSPGCGSDYAACINVVGYVDFHGTLVGVGEGIGADDNVGSYGGSVESDNGGVRPALWVNQ
jgi:hypothetical protein